MAFEPHSAFADEISQEGVDALHVVEGEIVLTLDRIVHRVAQGECVVFSAAYRHAHGRQGTACGFVDGPCGPVPRRFKDDTWRFRGLLAVGW